MISASDMTSMEEIIVDHAGPLGKFVIKKSIKDLGLDLGSFDKKTKEKFISLVLERAIYDTTKWDSVRREILDAWGK